MFNSEMIPTVLKNYSSSAIEPSKKDVLCGKDTTLARHPGNQLFREKIQAELPHYLTARSKQDKMRITKSIVQYITIKQGSRFLKLKTNGQWVEIDSQAARDKVSHALRFAARQKKKTAPTEQQFDDSSSQGSYPDDASSSSSSSVPPPPPPPMPARQQMERDTTNVEELFAAFEGQALTTTSSSNIIDPVVEQRHHEPAVRRDSANMLLSFLSKLDFDFEDEDAFAFGETAANGVREGYSEQNAVTQWAAC